MLNRTELLGVARTEAVITDGGFGGLVRATSEGCGFASTPFTTGWLAGTEFTGGVDVALCGDEVTGTVSMRGSGGFGGTVLSGGWLAGTVFAGGTA